MHVSNWKYNTVPTILCVMMAFLIISHIILDYHNTYYNFRKTEWGTSMTNQQVTYPTSRSTAMQLMFIRLYSGHWYQNRQYTAWCRWGVVHLGAVASSAWSLMSHGDWWIWITDMYMRGYARVKRFAIVLLLTPHGISNQRQPACLFISMFSLTSTKSSNVIFIGHMYGVSIVGGFPTKDT